VPSISFVWNPILVDLRREVCPGARWQKQGHHWLMSNAEAQGFLRAAQARLAFQKAQARNRVDDVTWVIGFVRDAPFPLPVAKLE
jgi:hypothetical protein